MGSSASLRNMAFPSQTVTALGSLLASSPPLSGRRRSLSVTALFFAAKSGDPVTTPRVPGLSGPGSGDRARRCRRGAGRRLQPSPQVELALAGEPCGENAAHRHPSLTAIGAWPRRRSGPRQEQRAGVVAATRLHRTAAAVLGTKAELTRHSRGSVKATQTPTPVRPRAYRRHPAGGTASWRAASPAPSLGPCAAVHWKWPSP